MNRNSQNNPIEVTLPSDREIRITRTFDAPRKLVYQAHTDPNLIPQWWGPRTTTTVVEYMDVRPGGKYRFIHRSDDGSEFAFFGEFRELDPPARLVQTSEMDGGVEGAPIEVILETITFEEQNGKTLMTVVELCETMEGRDALLASGMEEGLVESYERMEEILARQSTTPR